MLRDHLSEGFPRKFDSVFELSTGSTSQILYPNLYSDFVFSNGVLMHQENVAEAQIDIKQLSRVTKQGESHLFIRVWIQE